MFELIYQFESFDSKSSCSVENLAGVDKSSWSELVSNLVDNLEEFPPPIWTGFTVDWSKVEIRLSLG